MNDAILILRACRAYHRRFGEQAPTPSMDASEVLETEYCMIFSLVNVNGVLAQYRYRPKTDKLVYVEMGPEDAPTLIEADEALHEFAMNTK